MRKTVFGVWCERPQTYKLIVRNVFFSKYNPKYYHDRGSVQIFVYYVFCSGDTSFIGELKVNCYWIPYQFFFACYCVCLCVCVDYSFIDAHQDSILFQHINSIVVDCNLLSTICHIEAAQLCCWTKAQKTTWIERPRRLTLDTSPQRRFDFHLKDTVVHSPKWTSN